MKKWFCIYCGKEIKVKNDPVLKNAARTHVLNSCPNVLPDVKELWRKDIVGIW